MNCLGFKLDKFGSRGAELWSGFFSVDSGLWNCVSLFQNLTSVYIRIAIMPNLEGNEPHKKDVKEGRIFKFFSFAPNLRILSLEMMDSVPSDGLEDGSPEIPLLDILNHSYVWKYLHTFNLNVFPTIKAEDLVEFLGLHARTLKCLQFDYVELCGTWRELLDFFKERLHLTGLKLDHLLEACGDHGELIKFYNTNESHRMEDYVLRGGAPFPPIRIELDD
ncbi:hypothetical protein RUND412_003238 [Rhizina undulata]